MERQAKMKTLLSETLSLNRYYAIIITHSNTKKDL